MIFKKHAHIHHLGDSRVFFLWHGWRWFFKEEEMMLILQLAIGVVTALMAGRKGYNPYIWFFAAGLIGLIVLAFLPFVNEKSELPEDERSSKQKRGNMFGGVLAGIAILILLASLIVWFPSKAVCLGGEALGRKMVEIDRDYDLREPDAAYNAHFDAEKELLSMDNGVCFDEIIEESIG